MPYICLEAIVIKFKNYVFNMLNKTFKKDVGLMSTSQLRNFGPIEAY